MLSRPSTPAPLGSTLPTEVGLHTYLLVIGGAFIVARIIYFFATSGFPPGFTTTYEYHPDGTTSTSTSPDTVEGIITVVLFLIGGALLRTSRAANSPSKR